MVFTFENAAAAAHVGTYAYIPTICIAGVGVAFWKYSQVKKIEVDPEKRKCQEIEMLETPPSKGLDEDVEIPSSQGMTIEQTEKMWEIYKLIEEGAQSFLFQEYRWLALFMAVFATIILMVIGLASDKAAKGASPWSDAGFAVLSFFCGATASVAAGYVGMWIATFSNARTTIKAQESLGAAFIVALNGGMTMGFFLVSLGVFVLWCLIHILEVYYHGIAAELTSGEAMIVWQRMFKALAGYGVGASSVALFARVGGGIYTKAADVGADLSGKNEADIPEDDPRNPAVIADNVGDNVGDIAGMGADLFGSMCGSSCACLVLSSEVHEFYNENILNIFPMLFPLALIATGIVSSYIAMLVGMNCFEVTEEKKIKKALQIQELVATVLSAVFTIPICYWFLGSTMFRFRSVEVYWWKVWLCAFSGLVGGLSIGFITEYFTSYGYRPVQEVSESCETGASTNIIYGLALGYKSTVFPTIILGLIVVIANALGGIYGISVATLGVLTTLVTSMAIDAYGPICDNAGGIAEMVGLEEEVRDRTDALDAAGNTTAAIGKGFAIASACLVGIALLGAFCRIIGDQSENEAFAKWVYSSDCTNPEKFRAYIGYGTETRLLDPLVLAGLLLGSMLPFWFSAMTMKSVGTAALKMVEEVRAQFLANPKILTGEDTADYAKCIRISTEASLREMVAPAAMVLFTPIFVGFFFGTKMLLGVLCGAIFAGVHMATSSSNTGGAWDNAKKYIEAGNIEGVEKGSEQHKAAVIGDTVGDPLKDTSGPALNILIKIMGIIAVLFASAMVMCEKEQVEGKPIYYRVPGGLIGKLINLAYK